MSDAKKTRSTRLRGEMDEEFQRYCDKRDMSNAEALRAMVREVLEEDDVDSTFFGSPELAGTLAQLLALFGIAAALLSAVVQWAVAVGFFVTSPAAAAALGTLQNFLWAVAAALVAVSVAMTVAIYLEGDSE